MNTLSYKHYIIEKETEPWAIKAGHIYFFYHEGEQGASDCSRHGFRTIDEAKEAIDELVPMNLYAVTHKYGRGSALTNHTFYLKAHSHWTAIMESYQLMKVRGAMWFKRPKSICYATNV